MTTAKKRIAHAVADVGAGVVLASIEIAATPERVYRALTTPEELVRWWGSDELYRTTSWKHDLKVGGRFRSEGRGTDGSPFSVEGEYLELDPPRRLVHTWKPDWEDAPPSKVIYSLEAIAEGTRVVVRHEGLLNPDSCRSHGDGWERVLQWLSGHATAPEAALGVAYFMCRLIGPRPTFAMDMNADERAVMMAHQTYWRGMLERGKAIVFGPVLDPAGPWGLGVLRVRDEAELRALQAGDPAIESGRGFRYETMPMMSAVFRD